MTMDFISISSSIPLENWPEEYSRTFKTNIENKLNLYAIIKEKRLIKIYEGGNTVKLCLETNYNGVIRFHEYIADGKYAGYYEWEATFKYGELDSIKSIKYPEIKNGNV